MEKKKTLNIEDSYLNTDPKKEAFNDGRIFFHKDLNTKRCSEAAYFIFGPSEHNSTLVSITAYSETRIIKETISCN